MNAPLCLLSVHAHHAEGVHTVLVTCTGGEEGDILNPAMDRPEVRDRLHQVRGEELRAAVDIIGYDELVLLGYRDSGMAGTDANKDARSFAQAAQEEAVGRLVAVIRKARPQVILTYHEDQRGYPHPDHLRVHDISVAAFDAAGDPEAFPGEGEPWQPSKMYYTVWSRARMVAIHERFLELGMESPIDARWLERQSDDDRITTRIDISGFADVGRKALIAHATQIDPTSPFWFGLPPEVARTVHPVEEYELGRSLVETEVPESDLFAGVRQSVSR